ncbi:N(G),N(G)-dimethylarginine dimethylaminohydrolase 1-like [Rhincodon typus]|uniref:N(G),N(G)-dimethylarginine dimethylaminohydrolase 1-like n=1 Tax=Rhincodon typus TaxID=259920 RepID=UPI00202F8C25|nr:N(G),N(G)-dimethylarginine dimethylaminohydrolase 1-like [Rhincodon typus]
MECLGDQVSSGRRRATATPGAGGSSVTRRLRNGGDLVREIERHGKPATVRPVAGRSSDQEESQTLGDRGKGDPVTECSGQGVGAIQRPEIERHPGTGETERRGDPVRGIEEREEVSVREQRPVITCDAGSPGVEIQASCCHTSGTDSICSKVATVKSVLAELKLRVFEVTDEKATLDGSDVFFTGREFFVGISKWTNHKGAEYVAEAFKDFTVSIVHIPEPHHLKSFCSMGGPSTIIIGNSEAARKAIKAMEQLTDYQYDKLSVPDDAAANCIYARVGNKCNVLVHRTVDEFPESSKAFKKLSEYTLIPASCTEVAKLGASLSSCSILINKKFEY